ncbi:MAG TPA: hypothetical protein VJI98_03140 [Candidatus Nanoarchaeia archaeon]|nr:hypothetical protein [Candidatus Nanoarchaeia archaeon]
MRFEEYKQYEEHHIAVQELNRCFIPGIKFQRCASILNNIILDKPIRSKFIKKK